MSVIFRNPATSVSFPSVLEAHGTNIPNNIPSSHFNVLVSPAQFTVSTRKAPLTTRRILPFLRTPRHFLQARFAN